MDAITLVYYTANRIPEYFAVNVRNHLMTVAEGKPIISISQKPIDFGKNICVGDIGYSAKNIYKQILLGAKEADTEFLAMCEDDTIHDKEYFSLRPPSDSLYYNAKWNVMPTYFYFRHYRVGLCTCVAPTELLISTIENKFQRYEEIKENRVFAEPGRRDRSCGLTPVKVNKVGTKIPSLTFKHWESLSGVSKMLHTDTVSESLPHWGKATDVWKRFRGDL